MNNSQESDSEWNGEKQKEGKKIKWQECNYGKKIACQNSYNNHFKTNHPELNSSSNRSVNKPSRGRPKQYQYKQLQQKSKIQADPLLELTQIQENVGSSNLKGRQIYQNQPVFKLIGKFMQEDTIQNPAELKFIKQDKIYDVTMGRGLSILIKQLKKKLNKEQFLNQVILLITIYISYVIEQTEDQNVLSNGSIGLLPEFANIFILQDLEKRCQRLKITSSWINKPQKTIQVLSIFFRWLIFKQFTHTTATVNEQFLMQSQEENGQTDQIES